MRLLLDTHVAIWIVSNTGKIPLRVRQTISRPGNELFVSVVSLWEIGMKYGRDRSMPFSAGTAKDEFSAAGLSMLDVTPRHAIAVGDLAIAHGDPFDRMILAQAVSEAMRLVTHDEALATYSNTIITW